MKKLFPIALIALTVVLGTSCKKEAQAPAEAEVKVKKSTNTATGQHWPACSNRSNGMICSGCKLPPMSN